MTSAVWANQKRDRPVSTRPLSGIGVGRTTSKAESRSLATSSRRSPTSNRSRTLPDRTKPPDAVSAGPGARGSRGFVVSAGDIGSLLFGPRSRYEIVETGQRNLHVAQQMGIVE